MDSTLDRLISSFNNNFLHLTTTLPSYSSSKWILKTAVISYFIEKSNATFGESIFHLERSVENEIEFKFCHKIISILLLVTIGLIEYNR